MLEDGMPGPPGRVCILELLHGEVEVGDDGHEHGDVEGITEPQELRLPRQLNLPARSARRGPKGALRVHRRRCDCAVARYFCRRRRGNPACGG